MEDIISKSLKQAQDVLQAFVSNPDTVSRMRQAVDMLAAALENGNKILSCGNGGSLCDAAHFAEELTRPFPPRPPAAAGHGDQRRGLYDLRG